MTVYSTYKETYLDRHIKRLYLLINKTDLGFCAKPLKKYPQNIVRHNHTNFLKVDGYNNK